MRREREEEVMRGGMNPSRGLAADASVGVRPPTDLGEAQLPLGRSIRGGRFGTMPGGHARAVSRRP